jgi:hypothetical protein
MDSWHATFLGRRHLPREVTAFEIEMFLQIEHQQIACDALGFQWLTGHHRRALVRVLHQELDRTDDRKRLLGFARSWLYEHRLIIVHERLLRSMIAVARRAHETQLARRIDHAVEPGLMMRWRACSPTSSAQPPRCSGNIPSRYRMLLHVKREDP